MSGIARWLEERPVATIERLKKINHAATSSAHIILTLSYGLSDPHIRAINRMIVGLLLSRHHAQRSGNKLTEQRIEAKLQDFHEAINLVTGSRTSSHGSDAGNACKRAVQRKHLDKMELTAS
ncbi:hypothetical protein BH11CYA1_BH11CYA1_02190 [soil metagenome]